MGMALFNLKDGAQLLVNPDAVTFVWAASEDATECSIGVGGIDEKAWVVPSSMAVIRRRLDQANSPTKTAARSRK